MTVPLQVDDKQLLISEETWKDLITGSNTVAYNSVKELAISAVMRDGSFVIHRDQPDDSSVINHIHRIADAHKFFDAVDQQRAKLGL
ncbi:hypothetical protein ACWYXJ_22525 [Janthinobacterium lividum]